MLFQIVKSSSRFFSTHLSSFFVCTALVMTLGLPAANIHAAEKPKAKPVLSISQKTDINKANVEQLSNNLKGVGIKKAEAIIAWRKQNGKFKSVDQLTEVKGIGQAIVDKNRNKISI